MPDRLRLGTLFIPGVVVGLVAVASILSSCGGRSNSEPLTPTDYVRKVNTICAAAIGRSEEVIENAFIDLYGGAPPANATPKDLQALYAAILPATNESAHILRRMLEDLRAILAPDRLTNETSELWDAFEERPGTNIRRIGAAAADPSKAVQLDLDDAFPFDPENERAARLGFAACNLT